MRRISPSSSMPSVRKSRAPGAAMYSPHTLRRGKGVFSTTATERPARASSSAASAPAGPPPMTRTSNAGMAPGDEEVAEGRRQLFRQRPALARRPDARQLRAAEARAHADHRVMARDVVAADGAEQVACTEREARAARFAGDEERRTQRGQAEEAAQVVLGEMVQEQVGDDRIQRLTGRREELEYLEAGDPIDDRDFELAAELALDRAHQAAVAAAQVGNAARVAELARNDACIAHDGVDASQI